MLPRHCFVRRRHLYGEQNPKISAVPFWHGQRLFCQRAPGRASRRGADSANVAKIFETRPLTFGLPLPSRRPEHLEFNQFVSSMNGLQPFRANIEGNFGLLAPNRME
jgi:hypothetical protein